MLLILLCSLEVELSVQALRHFDASTCLELCLTYLSYPQFEFLIGIDEWYGLIWH